MNDDLAPTIERLSKIPQAAEQAPDQNPPNPEEAAPERPSGETQEQTEPAEPPIDPPASWDDEAKERFRQLPRDLQDVVQKRERDRDLSVRRGQDEIAKARKEIESKQAEAIQQAQQYVQHLQYSAQALHQQLLGDFADIKSPADAANLAASDPVRYLQFDARQKQVQAAYQQVAQHQQHAQTVQQNKLKEWAAEQDRALADQVPEWRDKSKREAEIRTIKDYAVEQGLSREEAEQAWSAPAVIMARKAMLFDKGQKTAAASKVVNLPKVIKPGTAPEAGEADRARAEAARSKLHKTGSLADAASALAAMRRAR